MDCAETRSTRSDRKRHRSRAERSEAELGHLKKDYLCRTVVVERVDLFDGVRKDCDGVICDVHGPDDFEVVFFDGCTRRLTMEELEVVIVPEHDTDDEGAPGGDGEDRSSDEEAGESDGDSDGAAPELSALEQRRLVNVARNQEILRSLEVDATHFFGGSRSTISVAHKVHRLLINGPTANNIHCRSGGAGTSGMRGVNRDKNTGRSASLPLSPAMLAPPTPNKSNCVLEGPRPALPTGECDTAGRWRAQIGINGKNITLGRYTDANEAARACDRCVRRALPPEIQRLCRPRGGRPPQPFPRMRRASLAVLGAPAFGSTFAQLFNDADAAAALVAADGELQPPPESSHANIKKLYRANAKAGVTRLHPGMLELWRLHTAAPVAAMPVALPVTATFCADGEPPTAIAWAVAAAYDDDEEGPRALPPAKTAPPARSAWRAMLGLTLPGASR